MKVGQKIKIYEVLTDGYYSDGRFIPKTFRPAGKKYSQTVMIWPMNGEGFPLAMCPPTECRHVATMRITKLK